MGNYLNPGCEKFVNDTHRMVYVDKTMLINQINSIRNNYSKYICVSRPRRFGKTMAMNMLSAFYQYGIDNKEIFKKYKISQISDFNTDSNKYDVLVVTMTEELHKFTSSIREDIVQLENNIKSELKEVYNEIDFSNCTKFADYFKKVYKTTKRKFIVLIDEWDCVFRERKNDTEGQMRYLTFLRDWLKDKDFIALAYMTGILPIKKYGEHSALNMFEEYSMENSRELAPYFGFTAQEVQQLCDEYGMNYVECKEWYDGYRMVYRYRDSENKKILHEAFCEMYSPLSVSSSIINGAYKNYWNKTETYEALKNYIMRNENRLREKIIELLSGNRIKIDTSSFANDMQTFNSADDVLTLLIHLGYLAYDGITEEVYIPNNEVRSEFALSIKAQDGWEIISKAIQDSDDLLAATMDQNADYVANALENAHFETSILQYNDENALSYVISLAYYSARRKYNIVREMPAGKGFADMVFLPRPHHAKLPAMIIELKWDKSVKTAIDQIKTNKYSEALKGYSGKLLIVGVNYNKDTKGENAKKHECCIEEVVLRRE